MIHIRPYTDIYTHKKVNYTTSPWTYSQTQVNTVHTTMRYTSLSCTLLPPSHFCCKLHHTVHMYALQLLNDYAATLIIPVDMFHHLTLSPDATHIAELHRKADQFIAGGLTPSTIATYSAGRKKYIQFYTTHQATPLPSSETKLILLASYLATTNISHTIIKVYLSAVRHMHVAAGLHELFSKQPTP